MTTCILHNYLRSNNVNLQKENTSVENNDGSSILRNLPGQGGNAQQEAFTIREIFTRYFNSHYGSVPWQYEKYEHIKYYYYYYSYTLRKKKEKNQVNI